MATTDKPQFVECGCCNCYHSIAFTGDCRDDNNRFASAQLDERYGMTGWEMLGLELDNEEE